MIFSRLSMVLYRDQVRRLPAAFARVGEGFRSADEGCRALLAEMGLMPGDGQRASAGADLPVAALAALGEAAEGATAPGHWLCADPVALLADRDRLLLIQWRDLELDTRAWNEIAALANEYLADVGVFVTAGDHGYLRLRGSPGITTVPPWRLRDGDVDSGLPAGSEALAWRGRMNEMQMALHGAAFNAEREMAGLAPVNGLWFWGSGALTAPTGEAPGTVCASAALAGDPVVRGMARRLGGNVTALPGETGDWRAFLAGLSAGGQGRQPGPGWVVWELPAALARVDADRGAPAGRAPGPGLAGFLKAAMASVGRGELGGLDLWVFDDDGCGHYRMDNQWRWWRGLWGSVAKTQRQSRAG